MKTTHTERNIKFIKWLSADDMHNNSKEWLTELKFIEDEQIFLQDLISLFTLQIIDKQHFSENKKVIKALQNCIQEVETLIKIVIKHQNNLKIIIDGVNQPKEEEEYKDEHRKLMEKMNNFIKEHKRHKKELFNIIKDIKKTEKQKRLI